MRGATSAGTRRPQVARWLAVVERAHEVVDVADGQPESLDFGQLGVAGHIRYMPAKLAERLVDELRAPSLLLVGLDALDNLLRWSGADRRMILSGCDLIRHLDLIVARSLMTKLAHRC